MKIKFLLLAAVVSFIPFMGFSQTEKPVAFKGIIIDAQTNEPIPSASVVLIGKGQVTRTNLSGKFTLLASANTNIKKQIKVSCVGYKTEVVLLLSEQNEQEIKLSPESHNLGELTVKKQKYHNKNNPAVELIEKVIANKSKNRKESLDYYENESYEKIQFAFNEISQKFKQKRIFKHFQFMFEQADSTDNAGEILPIYMKEVLSNHYYRKSPKDDKQIIKSQKMVNFQGLDNKGLDDNIKYMYQDINIYDNNILMLTNQFLSPIAPSAPAFYRYYITDTIQSGSEKFIKLFFGSRNKQDMLFQGYLYITMDGTYAIQGVELSVNKNINLNLVRDVKISQQFEKVENQGWVLKSDQTIINFAISKKGQSLLGKRTVSYKDYKFAPPSNDSIFKGLNVVTLDSANLRDEKYWEANRHQELSKSEEGTYAIVDSLQKVPAFRRTMDIAQIVFFGYKVMGKYEIGPVNTFYSYNPIEGIRARFGGRTTPEFSKKLNFETYVGYGFGDHNLKYFLSSTW